MQLSVLKSFAMPLVLLVCLGFVMVFGEVVPYGLKSLFYTTSSSIKEGLIFSLPFVIFSLVYNSISSLGTNALKFVVIIVPLICCSNFINTMLSYLFSLLYSNFGIFDRIYEIHQEKSTLEPMFKISIPKLLSNDIALLSGVIAGFVGGILKNIYTASTAWLSIVLSVITKYFFKILIPMMPLFVVGTAFKLQHEGMLSVIWGNYLPILVVFMIAGYGVVILQLLFFSRFNLTRLILYVKNIIPAVIVGFGSASSAAALPLSIKGAEDNSIDKKNASVIVPATVNVHLVGDCFFIPMIAMSIVLSFGREFPSLPQYLPFAISFVIAKFAVAAVPGGGILVMLPILQSYLGFSGEMLGLITALYVLFDPITTACNVAGNGVMAVLFDKIVSSRKN